MQWDEQRGGMSLGSCHGRNREKRLEAGDRTRVVLRWGDPQGQRPRAVQENKKEETSGLGDQGAAGESRFVGQGR